MWYLNSPLEHLSGRDPIEAECDAPCVSNRSKSKPKSIETSEPGKVVSDVFEVM